MDLWNQKENQRAARNVLSLLESIEKDIIRLKEQQRADQERFETLRKDVSEIRTLFMQSSQNYTDTKELIARIQRLENELTSLWTNFERDYLTAEDFAQYRETLSLEKEKVLLSAAIAKAMESRTLVKQIGVILGGVATGSLALYTILPEIAEAIAWILEVFR